MKKHRLSWELLGAAVGAGLASGREIASFFGQYGMAGVAGAGLSVVVMCLLADASIPPSWRGRWPERLWHALSALLLTATAGAMLAASGNLAALMLPVPHAGWLGSLATLLLAWLLTRRLPQGLMWVSRGLLAALLALMLTGLTLTPMQAAHAPRPFWPGGVLRSLCHGGFTAALLHPVLRDSALPKHRQRAELRSGGGLLFLLLLAGTAVLLRHPLLLQEPLPFVRMAALLGRPGFWLSAVSLYLAVLSTLAVCLRSLGGRLPAIIATLLTALLGFTGVVDVAYPLLGGLCAAFLLVMRLRSRPAQPH